MPRNNQLLHFAFREDKQWKLQQVRSIAQWQAQARASLGLIAFHGEVWL